LNIMVWRTLVPNTAVWESTQSSAATR
jgi:hypothetical protein